MRLVAPAAEELWSILLVLGFYLLPGYLSRRYRHHQFLQTMRLDNPLPHWDSAAPRMALRMAAWTFPPFVLLTWWFYLQVCSGERSVLAPIFATESLTPLAGRLSGMLGALCANHDGYLLPQGLSLPASWTRWHGLGFCERVASGLFAVALPEELFHRGYLMTTFERWKPARFRIFGVPFGSAAILSSAIFAAGHLVSLHQTSRLATFVPALAFAWLWRKTGTLWAPALYHLGCNLLMELLMATTFARG